MGKAAVCDRLCRNKGVLLVCLLTLPLFAEFFWAFPHLNQQLNGNLAEDDDFGFLSLPQQEWMVMRREWTGFVDLDDVFLLTDQEQNPQHPALLLGNTLKSRIRALAELPLQKARDVTPNSALEADRIARKNPPPLSSRVPKIIHQTWKSYQVQSVFENYTSSWRNVFPEWEYWFWTDEDVKELVRVSYPRYKDWFESFDGYAYFIQKADTWKYLALYAYGGVYADLDVQALKPFDESLMNVPLLLSTEPNEHSWILNRQEKTVCNAFMSSVASHPFWIHVLATISRRTHIGDPVDSTGPRMLQTVLDEYHAQREAALKARPHDPHVWREFPVVVTAAPELYMPFFDQGPVKHQCETDYPEKPDEQHWAAGNELRKKASELCSVLRGRDFVNVLPESSFTAHHWSHTWLGHVTDKILYDISLQMSVGPANNRSNKLPRFEPEELWVEKMLYWNSASTNISEMRNKRAALLNNSATQS